MTRNSHLETGRLGEILARQYLERSLGWVIRFANWRCPRGELDLVAWDGDWLVVVEVKTRRNERYGDPFESVVGDKLIRIRRLVPFLLHELAQSGENVADVRVDIVGLWMTDGQLRHLEHLRNAE